MLMYWTDLLDKM